MSNDKEKVFGRPVPYVLAMVVCDAMWRDPATGKTYLLGLFNHIMGGPFPVARAQLAVYIAMTDAHGKMPLVLRLADADESRPPVFEAPLEVEFADPSAVTETYCQIPDVRFSEPGEYILQLLANEELIIERRISVSSGPLPSGSTPSGD